MTFTLKTGIAQGRLAFVYFCTLPGHRQAGMEGHLVVGEERKVVTPGAMSISREPTDLPPPLGSRPPQTISVRLKAIELEGRLAEGTSYTYWTFGGKAPALFIRVRVGDTVELHLQNKASNRMIHSIDLHAVTGPGGGAAVMQVPPGQENAFTFRALHPGLYIYHCATPMVAQHIANGMYGLILVEPEEGLASLTSPPLTDVQTTLVPPGGSTLVELKLQVPGRYILVDHALSRLERGLVGFLLVEGPPNRSVFHKGMLR